MKITRTEETICVNSEYNPNLPHEAKQIGGRWNPLEKCWSFDVRDEARVESLYRSIYGEWDNDNTVTADAVTVLVKTEDISKLHGGIFFAGRQVARATGRDSGAMLSTGVVVLEGRFTSCGSMKNWRTGADSNTVFEIKDVPIAMAKKEMDNPDWKSVEILGDVNTAALIKEKKELLKRIAEIDELI